MSQKNQPRCVVMVEPMVNLQTEKMDNLTKESSKKKQPKEEKKAPAAKDIVPAESTSNGGSKKVNGKSKDTETAQSQENGVSNGVSNGKSSKKEKSKNENGAVTNGVSDVALNAAAVPDAPSACSPSDPTSAELNPDIIEEDALVQHLEQDNDELFTELNYDENSDNECSFDSTSPNFSPVGRSATRRSQAKKIPTPETPQLPSKGDTPEVTEVPRSPSRHTPDQTTPLREKVFKMKEQYTPIRVSPAPDTARSTRDTESPTADREEDCESKNGSTPTSEAGSAKSDTNFSKSRIKVSPYRRSSRISEQFSIMANYSGNNTTQQTELIGDISSSSRDPSGDPEQSGESTGEKSFSESLKCIKGRRSYRHLREYSLRNLSAQRQLRGYKDPDQENRDISISSVNATVGSNSPCDTVSSDSSSTKWTPVGHVVGRKRRQDSCEEARPTPSPSVPHLPAHSPSPALLLDGERPSKRARLLGYVATPLRHLREKITSSTPIHFGNRTAHKAEPLLVPSLAGDEVTAEEEMPMVADILPCKPEAGPEHKWCSIM